jgi:hypothetical protein
MPRKKAPDNSKPLSVEQARGRIAKAMRDQVAGRDPGPVTFRLKRTKKADETYPLRLTQQQRESMVHATRIKNKLKERLQQAGDGTQVVGFTMKELDHLNDELGQAALYAPGPGTRSGSSPSSAESPTFFPKNMLAFSRAWLQRPARRHRRRAT